MPSWTSRKTNTPTAPAACHRAPPLRADRYFHTFLSDVNKPKRNNEQTTISLCDMSNYNCSSGGLGTLILVNSTYNELNISHSLLISIKIEGRIIFLFPSILRTIGAGYTAFIVTHTVYLSRRKEVVSNQSAAVYVVSLIVCQEIERTVL